MHLVARGGFGGDCLRFGLVEFRTSCACTVAALQSILVPFSFTISSKRDPLQGLRGWLRSQFDCPGLVLSGYVVLFYCFGFQVTRKRRPTLFMKPKGGCSFRSYMKLKWAFRPELCRRLLVDAFFVVAVSCSSYLYY